MPDPTAPVINPSFAADVASVNKIGAVHQILEVVCRTTGLGFSAVARVTDTHWVACAVRDEIQFGLKPGGELELKTTICDEIRDSGQLVAIDHVDEDANFCGHHTPRRYGFQSYISVPIKLPDGRFFGTLCAIDPRPAHVNSPEIIGMFVLFADLIAQHLDAQELMVANDAALLTERETAQLREQFIAVLGHDLRNPLAAIDAGIAVLRSTPGNEGNTRILDLLQRSSARMTELIGNVLDFARGRLGSGLTLKQALEPNLESVLEQIVAELQVTAPQRTIHRGFDINHQIVCDSDRLAQMLSNLLANALTHSTPDTPIWVCAKTSATEFSLSVTNYGDSIEPLVQEQLFEPFARGTAHSGQDGLGLGLYIAAEIARAHDGTLKVDTSDGKICFTFAMPLKTE
ncbi:GAF domain-containing sensor histidine kinase [bacterium]|nr:MAG: GAF domain-containing sensor histidine kinase [bacterium]